MEMSVTRLEPDDDIGGSLNMICFRVFNFVLENTWYRSIDIVEWSRLSIVSISILSTSLSMFWLLSW